MNDTQREDTAAGPARILEHLAVGGWFADREKTLRYINAAGRRGHRDIVAALGKNVEACHKPESVAAIRALYGKWGAGSRTPYVYTRPAKDGCGTHYNILFPVQGPDGFEGVLELSFDAEG